MGFSNTYVDFIVDARRRGYLQNGGVCLAVGTFDFHLSADFLSQHGCETITLEDIRRHKNYTRGSSEWQRSCKDLSAKLLLHFGYTSYLELDINERADIVWDLNTPVPLEFREKYDLALDITVPYVANITRGYLNVMSMVKLGGEYVATLVLGDQTNRFQLTPSPNFLIDFFTANGFEVRYTAIFDDAGKYVTDYQRSTPPPKLTPLSTLLPPSQVKSYYLKQLIACTVGQNRLLKPIIDRTNGFLTPPSYYLSLVATKTGHTPDHAEYPIKDYYAAEYYPNKGIRTATAKGPE
jgi:hypothetical protein